VDDPGELLGHDADFHSPHCCGQGVIVAADDGHGKSDKQCALHDGMIKIINKIVRHVGLARVFCPGRQPQS